MFNDERINNQISNIFKNGIFFATLIAFIFLILKIIPSRVFNELSISDIISELFIIIPGIVIIILGYTKYKKSDSDERVVADRMKYYLNVSKWFLGLTLFGFAVAIPLTLTKTHETLPLNTLLIHLEIVGFIYLNYMFKKHKIYFNYTFIEFDTGYYNKVFKNILKLLILIIAVYGLAILISVFMFMDFSAVLTILFSAIISFLSLSLFYLYISWLERLSFFSLANGNKQMISQIITGSLLTGVIILSSIVSYKINTFSFEYIQDAGSYLSVLININNNFTFINLFLTSMLVSSIMLLFKNNIKGVGLIIIIVIFILLNSLYIKQIFLFDVFINAEAESLEAFKKLNYFSIYFGLLLSFINTIGYFMLVYFLIKNKRTKLYLLIPFSQIFLLIYSSVIKLNIWNTIFAFVLYYSIFSIITILGVVSLSLIKVDEQIV